jgi:hypothetical protein
LLQKKTRVRRLGENFCRAGIGLAVKCRLKKSPLCSSASHRYRAFPTYDPTSEAKRVSKSYCAFRYVMRFMAAECRLRVSSGRAAAPVAKMAACEMPRLLSLFGFD